MNKKIAIIMGSISDYETMKHAEEMLASFNIDFHTEVVSAHRTPKKMYKFAESASKEYDVIIAGAGGAAHLPGMVASLTTLPVIGVPIESKALKGQDSLLSIVQMPGGVPVATMAIGKAGAINAALMAARILAINSKDLQNKLDDFAEEQIQKVKEMKIK